MRSHVFRFRATYLTAIVSVATAIGAEFSALKDVPMADLHAKTWAFWLTLGTAVIVNAGNTILAALHAPPEPSPANVPSNPLPPSTP